MNNTLQEYRQAIINMNDPDATTANQWADRMHGYYKILRSSEEGRNGIIGLISDSDPHRCMAAAHSLQWVPDKARAALEQLRDSNGPASFDAEMTLQELDAGRLDITYNY
jgi:hypothetical protein